jgi:hypothetical protein
MKKHIKFILAGLYIVTLVLVATISNSTPPPPPCECCYTDHLGNECLNCDGGITLFSYNCGTIDPIDPWE